MPCSVPRREYMYLPDGLNYVLELLRDNKKMILMKRL